MLNWNNIDEKIKSMILHKVNKRKPKEIKEAQSLAIKSV